MKPQNPITGHCRPMLLIYYFSCIFRWCPSCVRRLSPWKVTETNGSKWRCRAPSQDWHWFVVHLTLTLWFTMHYGWNLNNITAEKWESIQEKALGWTGLDRFEKVRETVDWEKGPKGHHMHNAYYTSLSSKRMLSQARVKSTNAK